MTDQVLTGDTERLLSQGLLGVVVVFLLWILHPHLIIGWFITGAVGGGAIVYFFSPVGGRMRRVVERHGGRAMPLLPYCLRRKERHDDQE